MSTTEEQKYFERLNIPVLSIEGIKNLIRDDIVDTLAAWKRGRDVDKQCFHIIGPAGVGKTAICDQLRAELSEITQKPFEMIMLKSPVLSRDDIMIPFPVVGNGNRTFEMLYSDFVPQGEDTFGLFVIDECSRGDHSLQQMFWQVQNEYKIHLKDFPKGWFVITTDNPDDSEYQMDTMEDAAGLRRQLHLYTEVSTRDFLAFADEAEFHPLIIEFISTNPEYIYDFQAQKIGSVFANPASYEKLSEHLWKIDKDEKQNFSTNDMNRIEALASGLLNVNKARLFIEFAMEGKDINPKDIFFNYPKVRKNIKELITKKDNAGISKVVGSFINYMTASMPEYKKDGKEVGYAGEFLTSVPIDAAALFVTTIDGLDRESKRFLYMTDLHIELMKQGAYKNGFYDDIIKLSERE